MRTSTKHSDALLALADLHCTTGSLMRPASFGGRPANTTRTVRGTASCMHSDRAQIMVAIIVIVAVLSYILVLAAPGGTSEFELQSILGLVPSGECRHWVAR